MDSNVKPVKVAIAGLGGRGKDMYATLAQKYPDLMELVAIADIDENKVAEVAKFYNIPATGCFSSAEEMLAATPQADVMVIATQDKQHVSHAIPALKKGYHLLLEKPISPDLDECRQLMETARLYKRHVVICHVLRYTPFFTKLKEILDSGWIGEVTTVAGFENVGYWHQAHSYVRGNWRKKSESSPMILAKCCHDMDLYLWLTGKTCEAVSSFGNTYLFKKEKAPVGCTARCLDGCLVKAECPFDAEKIYLDNWTGIRGGNQYWPTNIVMQNPTEAGVRAALETGPYGRCVYHCDNDVVDHQIVNLHMTDGSLMSFTMSGFTADVSRECKIQGTLGEIVGHFEENQLIIKPFGGATETIDTSLLSEDLSGHGGGDAVMVKEFLEFLRGDIDMPTRMTSLEASVESHYVALAAEGSRLNNGLPVRISELKSNRSA